MLRKTHMYTELAVNLYFFQLLFLHSHCVCYMYTLHDQLIELTISIIIKRATNITTQEQQNQRL